MKEQVMIYEIKSSASVNAEELFHENGNLFYWNQKKFSFLNEGDYVLVVNKHSKYVLFTTVVKKNIPVSFDDKKNVTRFSDKHQEFEVKGRWDEFVCLEIIDKIDIVEGWKWKSLGSSETTYLNGERVNLDSKNNRIKNINQLKDLSMDAKFQMVLNESLENFEPKTEVKRNVWFVAQGATFSEDRGMKFLWAPKQDKKGFQKVYWTNVGKIKKGDIIFNYSDKVLKGVSIALVDAFDAENEFPSSEWDNQGYKVLIEFIEMDSLITMDTFIKNRLEFDQTLKEVKNKPFDSKGKVNQGYLWEFSREAGCLIKKIYGKDFGNDIIDEFFTNDKTKDKPFNTIEMSGDPIHLAAKTKPFILLAGISGTGKSRLVRTLAFNTCAKEDLRSDPKKPGNFEVIPVRSNWHDSSELMGYISRINGEKYITTSFLKFLAKAWLNIDIPFFLCLDEMNLAPVEQYFAEYLSIIETRQVHEGKIVSDYLLSRSQFENKDLYDEILSDLNLKEDRRFIDGIGIPQNLIVMGTVNMDETTHSFSRKVLDRAMTFEMNEVDLFAGLDGSKSDWSYPESFIDFNDLVGNYTAGSEVVDKFSESEFVLNYLVKLNKELEGTPFKIAYRVRDEFLIYCYYASLKKDNESWLKNALDDLTIMKVLSRVEGDEMKTEKVLINLENVIDGSYPKSNNKLNEMKSRLESSGYTSFWS